MTIQRQDQVKRIDYEIQLQGRLSQRWIDWFGNMTVIDDREWPGTSWVSLQVTDQASFLGQIQKLHNLGYTLLEIRRLGKR